MIYKNACPPSASWLAALVLCSLVSACGGGGRDPILGTGGATLISPTVTAVSPAVNASNVPVNTSAITASFSEAMDPASLTTASFTLACPSGSAQPGAVSYSATGRVATFTPAAALPASTTCVASITTAARDLRGNALAAPFTWQFTTGVTPDTTAPLVSSMQPLANATGVATNAALAAGFSEALDPLSVTPASFMLACPNGAAVSGTVGYLMSSNTATFTPSSALPASTVCTATLSTAIRDAAGNALAAPVSWSFTTGTAPDTTAPTVSSVFPANGATTVAINTAVTASFSEAMDPLSISTASFTLACPTGTAITGTVSYAMSSNVASFTPGSALPAATTCSATITTAVRDTAGNALATAFNWSFTTGAAADTTRPTVTAALPAAGATGIATNSAVTLSFSEAMDPLSITGSSLTLACPAGTPTTGTVAYAASSNSASFTPGSALPTNTSCTVTLSTAARDVAGNTLAAPFTSTFTTAAAPDTTAPTVSSIFPANGTAGVAVNTAITASFSEAIAPASITTASFSLACPTGAAITGTVSYAMNGNVASFTPSNPLPSSTTCTATVSTAVRDLSGNALAAPFTWSFTTSAAPDTTAPTVVAVFPANGTTAVATNTALTASFSEAMNPASLTSASFGLACPTGAAITGTVGYATSGNVATFTPGSALPASTTCTATLSTAIRDAAGNPLAAPFSWTFTTSAAPDTTPPTVSTVLPANGATAVAINTAVTASFSEAMDPLSITTASFTLACPAGTAITGTVGYAMSGNVATFTPSSALPASTTCMARITTAVRDTAGNALAAPFNWSFTTGAAPDTTRPTVTAVLPASAASNVAVNSAVTVSFSEAMDPLSITGSSLTLACPAGTAITGTVSYAMSSNSASFTPGANLPPNTSCTVTVTTAARDAAGNTLAQPFTSTFTTGAALDTTAPTVLSTNPVDGAVGVCINKTINASFSEAMDPLSITTGTFTLRVSGGAAVIGVVAYDSATQIATFNPDANLIGSPATNYTATIRGGPSGVKDVAGNALAIDRVTMFTTNTSQCTVAPTLGAIAPFGAFSGATVTNDGLNTVINGDVGVNGASTSITGFRDSGGNVYTVTPNNDGRVNGLVYTLTAPPGSVAGENVTQARSDARLAFNSISPGSLPGGVDVSSLAQCPSCGGAGGGPDELAGRTLPPGIYLSSTGTYDIGGAGRTTANLTLDAGGDAGAVWVFQTAAGNGTLNVGLTGPATPAVPIMVQLVNGAQAKNVFWYVPAGAVIGTGSTFTGTLLSDAANTLSTTGGSPPTAVTTTLNGRAISLSAGVTMTNSVINVPAP
ncbi:MAG: Ig-like domain-containing protein [Pseudomonadota bacterium]